VPEHLTDFCKRGASSEHLAGHAVAKEVCALMRWVESRTFHSALYECRNSHGIAKTAVRRKGSDKDSAGRAPRSFVPKVGDYGLAYLSW
jgi:hypothetical protein